MIFILFFNFYSRPNGNIKMKLGEKVLLSYVHFYPINIFSL